MVGQGLKRSTPLIACAVLLVVAAASVSAGGDGNGRDQGSGGESVPRVIRDVVTVAQGQQSGFPDPERMVIRDAGQWEKVWDRLSAGRLPREEAPEIDFDQRMLLGAFLGEKATGGYTIRIGELTEQNGSLRVTVVVESPGPDEMVTMALTSPYHIVSVPKRDTRVQFERRSPE
jgi:hypothetical protein